MSYRTSKNASKWSEVVKRVVKLVKSGQNLNLRGGITLEARYEEQRAALTLVHCSVKDVTKTQEGLGIYRHGLHLTASFLRGCCNRGITQAIFGRFWTFLDGNGGLIMLFLKVKSGVGVC